MSASDAPAQETKKATNNRHIQPETLEKILLNLAVKSLLRFSSVSKPWNSLIFGPEFIRKHRRQRIILDHFCYLRRPCPSLQFSGRFGGGRSSTSRLPLQPSDIYQGLLRRTVACRRGSYKFIIPMESIDPKSI